jgi:hypothetical protein
MHGLQWDYSLIRPPHRTHCSLFLWIIPYDVKYSVLLIIRVRIIRFGDYFFNLPSIWVIKLRTVNTQYLVHKSEYILFDSSHGMHIQAHKEWEVCEKSMFLSLCLAKGSVGV